VNKRQGRRATGRDTTAAVRTKVCGKAEKMAGKEKRAPGEKLRATGLKVGTVPEVDGGKAL